MIQDIAPHKLDNHYQDKNPSENSPVLLFEKNSVVCSADDERLIFPRYGELKDGSEVTYLFSIDDEDWFLGDAGTEKPEGYVLMSLHALRDKAKVSNVFLLAAYTGYHLWVWYGSNRYCGACGKPVVKDGRERALRCPECGNIVYPRINPAVIVGVINGDRILLTKYARGFRYNALVAGFTEIGETLEETVSREVFEETGLKVKNIRYYKSQPWGIAQDILAGFYCDVDGDDTIKMDASELKYAEWVSRQDVELQPGELSLTNEMMKMFRDGQIF